MAASLPSTSNPTSRLMSLQDPPLWNFDIDRWFNKFIPSPPWKHLPYPISRFGGYRETPPRGLGNILVTFWAFIGVICGISLVEIVSLHIPSFRDRGAPIISPCFVSDFHLHRYVPAWSIRCLLALSLPAVLFFLLLSVLPLCKYWPGMSFTTGSSSGSAILFNRVSACTASKCYSWSTLEFYYWNWDR